MAGPVASPSDFDETPEQLQEKYNALHE